MTHPQLSAEVQSSLWHSIDKAVGPVEDPFKNCLWCFRRTTWTNKCSQYGQRWHFSTKRRSDESAGNLAWEGSNEMHGTTSLIQGELHQISFFIFVVFVGLDFLGRQSNYSISSINPSTTHPASLKITDPPTTKLCLRFCSKSSSCNFCSNSCLGKMFHVRASCGTVSLQSSHKVPSFASAEPAWKIWAKVPFEELLPCQSQQTQTTWQKMLSFVRWYPEVALKSQHLCAKETYLRWCMNHPSYHENA